MECIAVASEELAASVLDTADVVVGGLRYRHISLPGHVASSLSVLTAAELDVAVRAAGGESTRQIALARKSSERTVSNQLGCVYRKLKLSSRLDLYARVFDEEPSR